MPIFSEIITLSKQIASSLLKDKPSKCLEDSKIFNESDKADILKNLTDKSLIKERLELANQIDKNKDWKTIQNKIDIPVRKLYWRYAAAAILIGMLATGYYLNDTFNVPIESTPVIVDNNIKTGTDKATLTLGDGTKIVLDENPNYSDKNVSSNGKGIIYKAAELKKAKIAYNYLTIPRGGQYFIKLSDGTQVWLNSESQLKYPIHFIDGETRKVELVYGEAYFDVSPSTYHNGAGFKVYNNTQEIHVLGTEFNIKAYKDETNVYTTLIEGSVVVNFDKETQKLVPSQQSNLNLKTNTISTATVDVYNETSWKDGVFSFDEKSLKEIMKVLERWYDMNTVFKNSNIEKEEFNGILDKDQNIEDILSSIKNFGIIKNYEITNKEVILE